MTSNLGMVPSNLGMVPSKLGSVASSLGFNTGDALGDVSVTKRGAEGSRTVRIAV